MNWFSRKLLEWYNPDSRNLPWKLTGDAYKIWLSEIILQQTRVEQGTPYYLAFIHRYPTVRSLAEAPLDDVLKLWEGLGYYSRARNLHAAAKQVLEQHDGQFPDKYEDILQLKGVGAYTAAAIASFAYHLPHAVVDGNVYRVLSRVFGIATPIDTTVGKKIFEQKAAELLDVSQPAIYNQAIMDFGALVCKPQVPLCGQCPFSTECKALEKNEIQQLPVKSKKLIRTARRLHYFVWSDGQSLFIRQRADNDIWKGLFEFPLWEELPGSKLSDRKKALSAMSGDMKFRETGSLTYKQALTHQQIIAVFHEISVENLPATPRGCIRIKQKQLSAYAFPKIIRQYLEDRLNFLS